MPGRTEPLDVCWAEVKALEIHSIVSLTSEDEIATKSPAYFSAILSGTVPCERWPVPVKDYGVPEQAFDYLRVASNVAESLKAGKNILVHCGAGIGRTGSFATLVLMRLRLPLQEALKRVQAAGSRPENAEQRGVS
jgi:protein-tyrosine phosphatase